MDTFFFNIETKVSFESNEKKWSFLLAFTSTQNKIYMVQTDNQSTLHNIKKTICNDSGWCLTAL